MNTLVMTIALLGASIGLQLPPSAPSLEMAKFIGFWRVTGGSAIGSPPPPVLLNIRVAGDELTIERRDLESGAAETSRYRLDGQSARTVRDGRPVDATAALEGSLLVIRTQPTAADPNRPSLVETFTVGRNTMMMDRIAARGTATTNSDEIFERIPDNTDLHGGKELR